MIQKAIEVVKSGETGVSTKMRALFFLRGLDTPEAALGLQECLTGTSVLLDHEIAYILGQMKQSVSVPFLFGLIEDSAVDDIVRHEAVEALGNFEDPSLVSRLEKYLNDPSEIVRESAVLAIRKLEEVTSGDGRYSGLSKYYSRDPAFPFEGTFEEAIKAFDSKNIEDKYRAIFYFRDLNTKESVGMLAKGFRDSSDLLKHEIAYVLGQMRNPLATDALVEVLENEGEAAIVRHEAAEALGNIGTDRARECLEKYLDSDIDILRESACVGLGICSNNEEDYADISKVH